jgi:WD40 repeat protein
MIAWLIAFMLAVSSTASGTALYTGGGMAGGLIVLSTDGQIVFELPLSRFFGYAFQTAAISPDGCIIALPTYDQEDNFLPPTLHMTLIDRTTGAFTLLPAPDEAITAGGEWSPNGNWLAYTVNGDLHLSDRNGTTSGAISTDLVALYPQWSPGGHPLYLGIDYHLGRRIYAAPHIPLTPHWPNLQDFHLTPAGDGMAFYDLHRLYFRDFRARTLTVIARIEGPRNAYIGAVRWSPDGDQLAFYIRHNGKTTLYVYTRGGQLRPVATGLDALARLFWSADGETIMYTREGRIYQVQPGQPAQLWFDPGTDDGELIAWSEQECIIP